MNSAQIGVLKEPDKVRLRRLLQRSHGGTLEPQIGLEVLSDFTDQALERELADEKLSALLVLTDLAECDGSWPEPVRLLHSAGGRSRLPGGLGGELLAWGLASSGLAGGLLGTSHLGDLKFLGFAERLGILKLEV